MASKAEDLGEKIAEQAAHLDAATHRLLTDLRAFDNSGEWYKQGFRKCANWLSWRVGWGSGTARDHVRVAQRLGELPLIDEALRMGSVSYSKVRAMVRVATPANEAVLVGFAQHSTGAQLDKLCGKYSTVVRASKNCYEDDERARRAVVRYELPDGMVRIQATLHPEEAAIVWAALDRIARERVRGGPPADAQGSGTADPAIGTDTPSITPAATTAVMFDDATAVTCDSTTAVTPDAATTVTPAAATAVTPDAATAVTPDAATVVTPDAATAVTPDAATAVTPDAATAVTPAETTVSTVATAAVTAAATAATEVTPDSETCDGIAERPVTKFDRVDALISMAQEVVRGSRPQRSPTELVVTIAAEALVDPTGVDHPIAAISDGTCVSAEAARRLGCDCGVVHMHEAADGTPLSVGRRTRTIPSSIKRALMRRDQTCRFPGCDHRQFIEGHHLHHWADGGETSLENMVGLCGHHHRFVHEYGYTIELRDGQPVFFDHRGREVVETPPPPPIVNLGWAAILEANDDLEIDSDTNQSLWDGRPMNYPWAVDDLVKLDRLD